MRASVRASNVFPLPGRPDEQDVALFDLHIRKRIHVDRRTATSHGTVVHDPLVVIVDRDTKDLLRAFLADDELIELPPNFDRLRHAQRRALPAHVITQFLVEDAFADVDARVADVHARAGDELAHFRVALPAETAHREIARSGHRISGLSFFRASGDRRLIFDILGRSNDLIDQSVIPGFDRGHVIIPIGIALDLLLALAGALGEDFDQALFEFEHVLDGALDIAGRALCTTANLMDHDVGIRQRVTLAFRASR
jgi:hypothetical protein